MYELLPELSSGGGGDATPPRASAGDTSATVIAATTPAIGSAVVRSRASGWERAVARTVGARRTARGVARAFETADGEARMRIVEWWSEPYRPKQSLTTGQDEYQYLRTRNSRSPGDHSRRAPREVTGGDG